MNMLKLEEDQKELVAARRRSKILAGEAKII